MGYWTNDNRDTMQWGGRIKITDVLSLSDDGQLLATINLLSSSLGDYLPLAGGTMDGTGDIVFPNNFFGLNFPEGGTANAGIVGGQGIIAYNADNGHQFTTTGAISSFNNAVSATKFRLVDNDVSEYGTGGDATIKYDGTDLVINPKVVGSGDVNILGEVNFAGGASSADLTMTSPAVLKGDRMILMYSHAAGVVGVGSTTLYMKAGEVLCSGVKSPVMPRAGSILSLTALYDIANATGGPTPSITFESRINNTAALVSALSAQSNGTDKETRVTQARGTAGSTFAAGDNIAASFITSAIKGATMDVTNIIMLIEVIFND